MNMKDCFFAILNLSAKLTRLHLRAYNVQVNALVLNIFYNKFKHFVITIKTLASLLIRCQSEDGFIEKHIYLRVADNCRDKKYFSVASA